MSSDPGPHPRSRLHEQKRRLKAGDIEGIERVVKVIGTRKNTDMSTEADYWSRHRERMRYADFRARGACNRERGSRILQGLN